MPSWYLSTPDFPSDYYVSSIVQYHLLLLRYRPPSTLHCVMLHSSHRLRALFHYCVLALEKKFPSTVALRLHLSSLDVVLPVPSAANYCLVSTVMLAYLLHLVDFFAGYLVGSTHQNPMRCLLCARVCEDTDSPDLTFPLFELPPLYQPVCLLTSLVRLPALASSTAAFVHSIYALGRPLLSISPSPASPQLLSHHLYDPAHRTCRAPYPNFP